MTTVNHCNLPDDLFYVVAKHVWARREGDLVTVGMTDVAQHMAKTIVAVTPKRTAAGAERVGVEAIRTCLRVAPLYLKHALRMGQVPRLTAPALLEAREHQLRAHGAVTYEPSSACDLMQGFLVHGMVWLGMRLTGASMCL